MFSKIANLVNLSTFYDVFYSDRLYHQFYGRSGYANFGYWPDGVDTAADAGDALVDLIIGPVADWRDARVLDVACGHGASTRRLAHYFEAGHITGIGIDGTQVAAAKRNAPGSEFRRMDATALVFDDASFDVVNCVEAAFHFNTRGDFLREAFRVLKPGGMLVFSDLLMNPGSPLTPSGNYLENPIAYAAQLESVGFEQAQVVDVTADTWDVFREKFNGFVAARPSRSLSVAGIRDAYTVNVNSSWAIRNYVLGSARRGNAGAP